MWVGTSYLERLVVNNWLKVFHLSGTEARVHNLPLSFMSITCQELRLTRVQSNGARKIPFTFREQQTCVAKCKRGEPYT